MTQLTRQDIQTVVDTAKNRIMERQVTKQDVQIMADNVCSRIYSYVHNYTLQNQQQFFRQLGVRNAQYTQRLTVMESRIGGLEQELKTMRQLLERMAGQKPQTQQIIMPVQVEPEKARDYRVSYNPAA